MLIPPSRKVFSKKKKGILSCSSKTGCASSPAHIDVHHPPIPAPETVGFSSSRKNTEPQPESRGRVGRHTQTWLAIPKGNWLNKHWDRLKSQTGSFLSMTVFGRLCQHLSPYSSLSLPSLPPRGWSSWFRQCFTLPESQLHFPL